MQLTAMRSYQTPYVPLPLDEQGEIAIDNICEFSPYQQARQASLDAKYARQNPAYFAKITNNFTSTMRSIKQLVTYYHRILNRDMRIINSLQRRRKKNRKKRSKIIEKKRQRFHHEIDDSQASDHQAKFFDGIYLNIGQDLYIPFIRNAEDKKQSILIMIFWERHNFQMAKQQDDEISSELASMSAEEVESIATLRYSKCIQLLDHLIQTDNERRADWRERGFYPMISFW